MFKDNIKNRFYLMAAVFVTMVIGFHSMVFKHLPSAFNSPEEDLDYGWFVPLFSLYVVWRERERFYKAIGNPSLWGALATLPCLIIGFFGVKGLQVRFELIGFVGLLIAVPWAFFGWKFAKRAAFPALCLLFCMPIASYLAIFTVPLRLIASACAANIASFFGADVVRAGNSITMPNVLLPDGNCFGVDVASPCSGLRSAFALIALSVCYGYFAQKTWLRRSLLFAASLPIAVFANIVRISTICLVADLSPSFAVGYYHDFSGFVLFGVAIGILLGISALIDKIPYKNASACVDEVELHPTTVSFYRVLPVTFLVTGFMTFQLFSPQAKVMDPPCVEYPQISGFDVEELSPTDTEKKQLRGAEISRRIYKVKTIDKNGFWFQVSTVISGPDKSSLHRPELCLPSQGHDMGESYELEVGDIEWTVIPISDKGGASVRFAYTFCNQDGFRTSSHGVRILKDVWDRTINNKIDRWAMVTVLVPSQDENSLKFVLSELGGMIK